MNPQLLAAADQLRQQGHWAQALQAYAPLHQSHPQHPQLAHNLALCQYHLGQLPQAIALAQATYQNHPQQWQTGLLLARAQHQSGQRTDALHTLRQLRKDHPQQPLITLEAARRSLHTLGHARASAHLAQTLLSHPQHGPQAQRMQLLAQLYDRDPSHSATQLNTAITQHARTHLQRHTTPTTQTPPPQRTPPTARLQIGLIANQFQSSPVYYLTIGALQALTPHIEWTLFHRGSRHDWATAQFQALATHWIDTRQLKAPALADAIAARPLHGLIDLCGWMDPTALKALSTRPAPRQYKWVGGQSLSTGLACFDGFISDPHHTPPGSQHLYTEPLHLLPHGYANYTPPPYHPGPQTPPDDGLLHLGVVSNPAKLSSAFLQHLRDHWPQWQAASPRPLRLHLIDQRYQIEPLRQRISAQLSGIDLHTHTPDSHAHYLQRIGQLHGILDTWPYSGGLTTLEAHSLGVPVYTRADGLLFCERHSHAHNQLLGLPQPTLCQSDFSPAHALQVDRAQLRQRAAQRQNPTLTAQALLQLLTP